MVEPAKVGVVERKQLKVEPRDTGAAQIGHAGTADVADGRTATHGCAGCHMQGLAQSPAHGPELLGRRVRCNAAPQVHAHDLAVVELVDVCRDLSTQGPQVLGCPLRIPAYDMLALRLSTALQRKRKSQLDNRLLLLAHVPCPISPERPLHRHCDPLDPPKQTPPPVPTKRTDGGEDTARHPGGTPPRNRRLT